MKIFIFEYITGGGFIEENLPIPLVCEGAAMLLSVIKGLINSDFEINIILDYRLIDYKEYFKDVKVEFIKKKSEFDGIFKKYLEESNYYLIIAPEFDKILEKLTRIAEDGDLFNRKNLGCNSNSINIAGDKIKTYHSLNSLKKYLPETEDCKIRTDLEILNKICKDINYPVIFKPLDGVSGGGVSLIKNKNQIKKGIDKIIANTNLDSFIIQEFIQGSDSSVSLFIKNKKAFPLTLNYQFIQLEDPFKETKYNGGYIPYIAESMDTKEIFDLIKHIPKIISGLNGYIGIDLIIGDRPYIIEVNPRLTTSYVGIKELLLEDLFSQTILNSDINIDLDNSINNVFFKRLEFKIDKNVDIKDFNRNPYKEDFVTPLFKFENKLTGFMVLKSNSLENNINKLKNIQKYFKSRIS
ncbi:MAG: ATP-grasp domain-containing protein [Promethearchaeota archaeon]|nr:MAG: ATP-grasp domain-containing protein [Candidatus Lokiarchaeota archaeon]